MNVVITNNASYAREVQYFRKNQYVTVEPRKSVTIECTTDPMEKTYYDGLRTAGFTVEFIRTDADSNSNIFSEFTDDELKRIIKNLGISTQVRARWKLESIIQERLKGELTLGVSLKNYL